MVIFEKKRKGITLIELVLTVAIISVIIQVIYSIFFVGNLSFNTSKDIGFAQQGARIPIDYINKEVRNSESVYIGIEPNVYPYHSIQLESGNLVKTTYSSSEEEPIKQIISGNINIIEFIPIWKDKEDDLLDYNKIKLYVKVVEGENESIVKEFTTLIRLENASEVGVIKRPVNPDKPGELQEIPDSIDILYYIIHN